MKKRHLLPLLVFSCSILMSACGNAGGSRILFSKESKSNASNSSFVSSNESKNSNTSELVSNSSNKLLSKYLKHVQVVTDNVGIYGVSVTLSSQAAEKGSVEIAFTGEVGSPQENIQTNVYTINIGKKQLDMSFKYMKTM